MENGYIRNIFNKKNKNTFLSKNKKRIPKNILKCYNDTRSGQYNKLICNAPFTSLRFNLKGQVLVCCYNRTHVLASYPFDSIIDIWKGEKLNELRKNIIDKRLDLGCEICRKQIVKGHFYSVKSILYDNLKPSADYPLLLEFELENTCNLECIMCNCEASSKICEKENNKQIQSKIYDDHFIEKLKPFLATIQRANFIGGEPFLIAKYYQIVDEILAVNPSAIIHFSTNGTVLNDRIKIMLEKGKFDISLSIDSINIDTYEAIRINASYESTFMNLKYFHDYCISKNTSFCIWVCPLTINRYEIPEIFEYFSEMGIPVYLNSVMDPQNLRIANLSLDELVKLSNYYKSYEFKKELNISIENYSRYTDFVNQVDEFIDDKKKINEFLKDYQEVERIKSFMIKKIESYYENSDVKISVNLNIAYDEVIEKISGIFEVFSDIDSLHEILVSFNYFSTEEIVMFFKENSKYAICEYLKKRVVSIKM